MAASKPRRRNYRKPSHTRPAAIEPLEQRLVFSTITVNTLLDNTTSDSLMSLREAIELMDTAGDSNAALGRSLTANELAQINITQAFGINNRIVFDPSLAGGSIMLGSALDVDGTMTIDGDVGITLVGGGNLSDYRAFQVKSTANLTVEGMTVSQFRVLGDQGGAAFHVDQGTLTLNQMTLHDNINLGIDEVDLTNAFGGSAAGGAIYGSAAQLTITDSTFYNNSARGGVGEATDVGHSMAVGGTALGGAIHLYGGTAAISGSTFYDNIVAGGDAIAVAAVGITWGGMTYGGAIYFHYGTLTLTNSTITNNTAQGGVATAPNFAENGPGYTGGIVAQSFATLTVDFATFSENQGLDARNLAVDNSTAVITHSIIGQSDNSEVDVAHTGGGSTTGSENLVRNTVVNMGVISTADPLLGALANNGGPTFTMKPQAGSPVQRAATGTLPAADQRGMPRVTGAADLGAFELLESPVFVTDSSTTLPIGQTMNFLVQAFTEGATPMLSLVGTLPAGMSFVDNGNGQGSIVGTPDLGTGGVYNLTLTAANGTVPDAVQNFTLTITMEPLITSESAATFHPDRAGAFLVTTEGDPTASLSYTGTLPTGLTFTDNGDGTATLTGTTDIAAIGVYSITVTADNGVGTPAQQTLTLTVELAPVSVARSGVGGQINVTKADGTLRYVMDSHLPGNAPARLAVTRNGDVIAGTGPGVKAQVNVMGDSPHLGKAVIEPFGNYRGGVFVAAGDVDGDGVDDIIVSAGKRPGAKAGIRVYSGVHYGLIADIWAFNVGRNITLASADLNGDGHAEVIASKRGKVRVFDGQAVTNNTAVIQAEFKPFANAAGGLFLAAGDVNHDNQADLIVSRATGRRPWVAVFNGNDQSPQTKFRVAAFSGTPVTSHDVNDDGYDDLLVVVKQGNKSAVQSLSGVDGSVLETFNATGRRRIFIA